MKADLRWQQSRRASSGFTLIELLIVVGIIALLAALILGAVRGVREQSQEALCQQHQRSLWQGILAFAADHDGRMPGNQDDSANPNPDYRDWLMGSWCYSPPGPHYDWTKAPQAGTLWRYINDPLTYRCPTRTNVASVGSTGSLDVTSNGHFDYAFFLSFAGARLEHLPAQTTVMTGSGKLVIATPVIVEEQPNSINNANIEGGHANTDFLAHNHRGGSYYISPDGSAHWFNEPRGVNANSYFAPGPSGRPSSLGQDAHFGLWERQ